MIKNVRGVTLISLVITIIVLLILASIATYSGANIIKQSKFTKFTTQLKMMQTQVNELYEKYTENKSVEINGKTYTGEEILNIGKDISTLSQTSKVFNTNASGITDNTGYKYYDKETIKSLNIEGLEEEEYFVNVSKRSVISYEGFAYDGKMYYTLDQLQDGLYNVGYSENTGKPTFDVDYEFMEGGKYRIRISNIKYDGNIDKWQVKYQKEGQDYWSTTEDYNFVVNEIGEYKIYIQNDKIISEEKSIKVGIEIGDTVTYEPSGTYKWEAQYCSSSKTIGTDDVILDSSSENFKISKWKVLDIKNGKVTLIPEAPTTGKVYLGEAQGYNNGVKLLNDACSSLYGNKSKGIEARSINIDDIESYMTDDAKNGTDGVYKYNNGNATYNTQVASAYTTNKSYPTMYAREKLSVINGTKNSDGLKPGEQTDFIKRTEKSATGGKLVASTSIQPYQLSYTINFANDNNYFKKTGTNVEYKNLFIPNSEAYYWIATRGINTYKAACGFDIYYMGTEQIKIYGMQSSNNETYGISLPMFPIISLNNKIINKNNNNEFFIE